MGLTKKQIKAGYDRAAQIHKDHLAMDNVKLPAWGNAKSYWLGILMHYSPDAVSKNDISDMTRRHLDVGSDQQVRHLKRDGWNITKPTRDTHALADPYKAHSGYARQQHRAARLINATDFEDIKELHGFKCATCGAREGEPDPRYGDGKIQLEEGHKDPEKALDLANTIPQCENCNRTYKDDFTFDENGRVRAVASERPVMRASDSVKARIKEALRDVD